MHAIGNYKQLLAAAVGDYHGSQTAIQQPQCATMLICRVHVTLHYSASGY